MYATLANATAIANNGDIVVNGSDSRYPGVTEIFLLQPEMSSVPLPASAWLLLSAMGGLGFIVRRRQHAALLSR